MRRLIVLAVIVLLTACGSTNETSINGNPNDTTTQTCGG